MSEVLEYLASKDVEYRVAPNSNVRTTCFFHDSSREPHEGSLYIRYEQEADQPPGLFFCHVCHAKGSLNTIKRHFGDDPDADAIPQGQKVRILQAAAEFYANQLTESPKAIEYLLNERGISPETLNELQLGVATGDGLLNHLLLMEFKIEDIRTTGLINSRDEEFFPANTITIPYRFQNSVVQIRGRVLDATKNKYRTPPGQQAILYNIDSMLETNEVILTEGEFDAIILHELGYNAIAVPGTQSFKEEWAKYFTEMKRVFICFDTDEPGQDGAARLAAFLGSKARIIELPRPQSGLDIDLSDYLQSMEYDTSGFDLLLKKARTGSLVRVEDAFDNWMDREGNPNLKGLETGYSKLDSIIKPGLLPGQVAIFLARTGTGKTIQMVNFMHRMIQHKPDIKILFLSLEQTANEWFDRARRLQGFYDPELAPEFGLNESVIDYYKDNLLMVEKNRVDMEEFRAVVRQAREEWDGQLDLIVVDYLGYWARAFKGEPYVRTSDAVMALKQLAKEEEVVIISPHQVNRGSQPGTKIKTSDSRESGVVEETADFMLAIEKPIEEMNASTAQGTLSLEILKSRHGGVGTSIEMIFAPTSLAVVPRIDDLYSDEFYRQAQNEVKWRAQGEYDFEKVLERHRTGNRSLM